MSALLGPRKPVGSGKSTAASKEDERDYSSITTGKSVIMAGALGVLGAFEFLECVEQGDSAIEAGKKALKRSALRAEAVREAAKKVAPRIRAVEGDGSKKRGAR